MKRSLDADLKVILDDGEVMVHSVILSVASKVFHTMLTSGLSEEVTWTITLPGKKKDTFQLMYNMLHSETGVPLTLDNAFDIAMIAHEYEIKSLFATALTRIHTNVPNCVPKAYVLAKRLDLKDLLKTVSECMYIAPHVGSFFMDGDVFALLDDELSGPFGDNLLQGIRSLVERSTPNGLINISTRTFPKCKYACKSILEEAMNCITGHTREVRYQFVNIIEGHFIQN